MTQEDKQLLIKDLCARLPYGTKVSIRSDYTGTLEVMELNCFHLDSSYSIEYRHLRPYLRSMSSMTEEEKENLQSLHDIISDENYGDGYSPSAWDAITEWEDYCNSRHLDYRGLIPMGLALEAPEGMYKNE